jgi:hypothetical protein
MTSSTENTRDTQLDRIVAIKTLPDTLASDPQFRARFEQEARDCRALRYYSAKVGKYFPKSTGWIGSPFGVTQDPLWWTTGARWNLNMLWLKHVVQREPLRCNGSPF